jgi:nucleotide-binding universal stress UspA family protein
MSESLESREHVAAPLVVVGFDGSDCSREALTFAVQEARMRGARLRIVSAWTVPVTVYAGAGYVDLSPSQFEQATELVSADAVTAVAELDPTLDVEPTTPNEQAAAALIAAAEDADLLVVGSRGHGGFARLLLGSVSEQVAHHATCPVTIVRAQ